MSVNSLRANLATIRGFNIPPGADDFISVAVPPNWTLGGTLGAATQVLEESSDRSATITLTLGSFSLGHALMAQAYQQQQAAAAAGGSPVSQHSVQTANGDTVAGIGIINPPPTAAGGTASGNRAWQVLLQEATFTPAVGLAAALAAAGTV